MQYLCSFFFGLALSIAGIKVREWRFWLLAGVFLLSLAVVS